MYARAAMQTLARRVWLRETKFVYYRPCSLVNENLSTSVSSSPHGSLLAAAVSERDGQFWVTPLSKENSTHTDGYRYSFQVHLRVGLVWPEISGEIAIFMGPKDLLSRGFRYPGQPLPESWITQLRHIGSPLAEIWPQSEGQGKLAISTVHSIIEFYFVPACRYTLF